MTMFEDRIDDIKRLAAPHFRRLGPEGCEEAVQNTLGLCWLYWLRLVKQGKAGDEACFSTMVWYSVKHTKLGRMPQGCERKRAKCVLDYARRRMRGVNVEPMDLDYFVGASATVPETAAFRIDTPTYLESLGEKDKGIALDLAAGLGTGEVARKRSLSPSAISQARTRIKRKYDEFHGEAA